MKLFFLAVSFAILFMQGCSKEDFKRSAYETIQNIRKQKCRENLSSQGTDCMKGESYEEYQRKRGEQTSYKKRDIN